MLFDKKLLDIVACPICKGKLELKNDLNELWCRGDRLAYSVKEGIPVLLDSEARTLTMDELEK
ncbi:Trm112 family protein [Catenovulum maritimum]|uniref:UPF0434 protein XM47_17675 n=1 Tax=Catenovulum maritimum TaxID=1513271 RepID=A0A0J8GM18_9ALTE|nr:Trm112 family protein [Catenovulum maritimum]KMT63840.1 hypothetical protein XM47_17675 [Catenovulum maritimum]